MMTEYIYEVYDGGGAWSGRVLRGEIIRCRDCRFYTPETIKFSDGTRGSDIQLVPFCDKLRRETNPDGFCAWAERSE